MSSTEVIVSTTTLSPTTCLNDRSNSQVSKPAPPLGQTFPHEHVITTLRTAVLSIVQGPEWLETLRSKGWTIVPETIPKASALKYANEAYAWLEDWGYGFNRTDPATRGAAHLPYTHRAGIFNRYVHLV